MKAALAVAVSLLCIASTCLADTNTPKTTPKPPCPNPIYCAPGTLGGGAPCPTIPLC